MRRTVLLELLAAVERGEVNANDACERLASLPYEDIGHARIDHHRSIRTGLPEVIYAAGKSAEQTTEIFERMAAAGSDVLATRVTPETAEAVLREIPSAVYHSAAQAITLKQSADAPRGEIAVLCAGTSDIRVAEEAAVTAELFGVNVARLFDVGVAGLHRLLAVREKLAARVV